MHKDALMKWAEQVLFESPHFTPLNQYKDLWTFLKHALTLTSWLEGAVIAEIHSAD